MYHVSKIHRLYTNLSSHKPLPTATIVSEKLEYIDESFLPGESTPHLKIGEDSFIQSVRSVYGNYIIDLEAMVRSMSEVASCNKYKEGPMEMLELKTIGTCTLKFYSGVKCVIIQKSL